MSLPIIRYVLNMGFAEQAVFTALMRHIKETGRPFFEMDVATECILSVLEEESKKTIKGCEHMASQAKEMASTQSQGEPSTPVQNETERLQSNDSGTSTSSEREEVQTPQPLVINPPSLNSEGYHSSSSQVSQSEEQAQDSAMEEDDEPVVLGVKTSSNIELPNEKGMFLFE